MKNILASFKTAIILLVLIVIGLIPGTYITPKFTEHFYATASPLMINIYNFLQLSDSYHSWWFTTLIVLLLINIITCSIYRFPSLYKMLTKPSLKVPKKFGGNSFSTLTVNKNGIERLFRRIKKRRYHIIEQKEGETRSIILQFGRWRHFSVFFIHLSIITIAVLGATTAVVGFKGYLTLPDGASSNIWHNNKNQSGSLPFYIKNNYFEITHYRTGQIKAYITHGEAIDGSKIIPFEIKVNHPFVYKNIWFYQTGWDVDKADSTFVVNVSSDGAGKTKTLKLGSSLTYKDIDLKLINYTNRLPKVGDALLVEVKKGNFDRSGWISPGYPVDVGDFTIELQKIIPKYITIIQASKTPGAFFMLIALYGGIFFTMVGLFLPYRRHQLFIVPIENGKYRVYKRRKSIKG